MALLPLIPLSLLLAGSGLLAYLLQPPQLAQAVPGPAHVRFARRAPAQQALPGPSSRPDDYHAHPANKPIQLLTFRTTRCYGRCPVFTLQIDSSGQTRYEACQYVARPGTFTTRLPRATQQQLWHLVNAVDFERLPDKPAYLTIPETSYFDLSTYTLVITYGTGQQKTVGDLAGRTQTVDLERVYQALLAVQQTYPWK
jgi:hypothetical protein